MIFNISESGNVTFKRRYIDYDNNNVKWKRLFEKMDEERKYYKGFLKSAAEEYNINYDTLKKKYEKWNKMKQLNLRDNKDKKEQKENDIVKDKTEHAINTEKEIGIVKNKTEHTINTEKEIDIVKDKTEHTINTEKEIDIVKDKTEHTINTEKELENEKINDLSITNMLFKSIDCLIECSFEEDEEYEEEKDNIEYVCQHTNNKLTINNIIKKREIITEKELKIIKWIGINNKIGIIKPQIIEYKEFRGIINTLVMLKKKSYMM